MRALILAALLSLPAAAAELSFCVDSNDWAPHTYAAREGQLQILVRMAAEQLGHKVRFTAVPWRRCQSEVEAGRHHAMVGASTTWYSLPRYAFPRRDGTIDTSRALVQSPIVLVHRVGGAGTWDGKTVHDERVVLFVHAYAEIEEFIHKAGAMADGGAHSDAQNVHKILGGRSNFLATYDGDAAKLVAQPEFAGKLEVLSPVLGQRLYYLAFNQQWYAAHGSEVEALWSALGPMRDSAAYKQAVRSLN